MRLLTNILMIAAPGEKVFSGAGIVKLDTESAENDTTSTLPPAICVLPTIGYT